MRDRPDAISRRELAKRDKHDRILAAARELFTRLGVSAVTTQQVADRADVAIGTLYLYASTKAELLIMVQNEKFAAAIKDGLQASARTSSDHPVDGVLSLLRPVVACVREQVENGRTYLHELIFGDPTEPYRRAGLELSARLEDGIASILARGGAIERADAATLARVITAVIHVSTTATLYIHRSVEDVLADIRTQLQAVLALRADPA